MANPQNFISEDTTIKGSVTTASSLTVAGAVEGDINAGGDVVILADASVKGDISGPAVTVSGKVEGRVNASGRLLITARGFVHGDISVRSLLIEEGGTLQGQCSMGAAAATPKTAAPGNGRLIVPPPSPAPLAAPAPVPPRPTTTDR
ncbi:MAG: polymer-forming cytoskeletal protein [Nannocystaceae bacterium]|nr:polymer-forming cytoskeletal protein [Nannocystaceae bacterium]